jgi:septal ring factor EnvC (AmiA/AmiB activator)
MARQRISAGDANRANREATLAKDRHTAERARRAPRHGWTGSVAATFGISLAAALIFGSAVANAQNPGNPGQARESLDKSRRELEASRQRTQGLEKSIADIHSERERLSDSLRETARIIHDSEARLTAIERQQATLAGEERKIREDLSERHGKIAVLLSAMQRMGRNPPPVMITRREDALQMVRSAMILARAFPELSEKATELSRRLSELVKVMEASKVQSAALRAETASHEVERTRLAQLIENRRKSLDQHKPELEAARRHAADTAKRIDNLTSLIASLDAGPAGSAATRTPAKPAETPAASTAELPVPQRPGPSGGPGPLQPAEHMKDGRPSIVAIPTETPSAGPAMAELVPSDRQLASLYATPMKPAVPFASAKGSLPFPAQGKRVLAFGDKTQFGAQSMGTVFETRFSAQVRSPCDGRILYAGPFRTWGQLLIVNADDGYHILLAGLSEINVQAGEFVLAGETVGFMNAAPKSGSAKAEGNAPVLYVEFRKDNRPIDPEPWWNVRS